MRLLLVEDDAPLARALAEALRLGGYKVDWFATAKEAELASHDNPYDAVILDLNLPDQDGLSLLKRWRNLNLPTPILILSARDELDARVRGLDLGADDYLTKPFELVELEARLRVLIRRMHAHTIDNRMQLGRLILDLQNQRAYLQDTRQQPAQDLKLTAREFTLLRSFALKPQQVLSKEQLIPRLIELEEEMSINALDILIHRLRKKLEGSGLSIRTLRGFGYLLETEQA